MQDFTPLAPFIDAPDTIDFIAQNSDYFRSYIADKPYIVPTTELTGGYLIAYVDERHLDEVTAGLGTAFISSESTVLGLLDRQALEAAGILQIQQQPFLDLRGRGVLIGIVDTGIDYTLDIFRYEDGTTKIAGIYDQTIRGPVPFSLSIGTEYTREQINEALLSEKPLSVVPSADTVGHGTFLASIMAGRETGTFVGAAPDSELLIVKLKKARNFYLKKYLVPPGQNNAYESSAIMIGVEYIIQKARQLSRPVAICIGLGTNLGGHEGSSLFSEYLSEISRITGVSLCIAAGNESQARHHYKGILSRQEETQSVEIRAGENAGDIYLSMWNNGSDRLSVSVRSPTGEVVGRVPARMNSRFETRLILERAVVIVEYQFPTRGTGSQNTIIKLINATPGIWTVTVFGDIVISGEYHVWLPITGFVAPGVEFLMPDPYYTLTIPGVVRAALSCGGYNAPQNSLYNNTSWGPTRLQELLPDLCAPAVDVGGFYPSGYGAMSGTSVAAAITTGACALMLQWGIIEGNDVAMSTFQIKTHLIRGATRDQGIKYPNPQWGFGKLNLIHTFDLLR